MDLDRLKAAITAIVRGATRRMDYLALYPAKVLTDHGDNTLDLEPDDARLGKLVKVPLRLFLPGVTLTVVEGARVLLGFEGGDPARPVAQLWHEGTLKTLTVKASTQVVIDCPDIRSGSGGATKHVAWKEDVEAHFNAIKAVFDTHLNPSGGPPPTPFPATPSMGTTKTKAE